MSEDKKNNVTTANQENNTENTNPPVPADNGNQDQDDNKKGDKKKMKKGIFKKAAKAVVNFVKDFGDNHPVIAGFLETTFGLAIGGAGMIVLSDMYVEHKRKNYTTLDIQQEPVDTTYKTVKVVVPESNAEPAMISDQSEKQAVQELVNTLASSDAKIDF